MLCCMCVCHMFIKVLTYLCIISSDGSYLVQMLFDSIYIYNNNNNTKTYNTHIVTHESEAMMERYES